MASRTDGGEVDVRGLVLETIEHRKVGQRYVARLDELLFRVLVGDVEALAELARLHGYDWTPEPESGAVVARKSAI